MKKPLFWVTMIMCFGIYIASAEGPMNVGFNPMADRQVQPAEMPLVYLEAAPNFIYPAELGFGVAVGVPYDMFYYVGTFYLCKDRIWYAGSSYLGPWAVINYRTLPPPLRIYKIANIRTFRDRDYLRFHEKREDYKGKHFRPEAPPPRQEHRDMKEERRDERKEDRGRMH